MDKIMHNSPHETAVLFVVTSILGVILQLFDWLPADLLLKALALLGSGGVTAVGGVLLRRITVNLLKKAEERRLLPSILSDPDKKDL